MSVSEKSPIGYFLEVELKYPDEFHDENYTIPITQ